MRYSGSRALEWVHLWVSGFGGVGIFSPSYFDGSNGYGNQEANPQEKPHKLSDGAGLYMWVMPSGGRKWRASYRHDGKQKTLTFGGYPEVSLALARERHGDARRLLAEGLDPMDERKTIKRARKVAKVDSFASVTSLWLEHWQEGKTARHVDSVRRRMASDILPALGSRPIDAIEAPETVAMTKVIEQRGAHDIAKRALETTGQVFRYAIAHGFSKRNQPSRSGQETF